MAFDYNKLYGDTPNALGAPNKKFVTFFDQFTKTGARILDVGCGQGRDTLFMAKLGHSVVGVDMAANGIKDLIAQAKIQNLNVEGIVADICNYRPEGVFDVVLIDRTLHMLAQKQRLATLEKLCDHISAQGWLLIADEPRNIPRLRQVVENHQHNWVTHYAEQGYLFMQRV